MLEIKKGSYVDTFRLKKKYNYIERHYLEIVKADCVLVTNWNKKGKKNYVGGNSFLEMGFAHVLNKPIYLLRPIPDNRYYYHEMRAMEPIVLNGNLKLIDKQPKSINIKS